MTGYVKHSILKQNPTDAFDTDTYPLRTIYCV